jgi:hypothetical protein
MVMTYINAIVTINTEVAWSINGTTPACSWAPDMATRAISAACPFLQYVERSISCWLSNSSSDGSERQGEEGQNGELHGG